MKKFRRILAVFLCLTVVATNSIIFALEGEAQEQGQESAQTDTQEQQANQGETQEQADSHAQGGSQENHGEQEQTQEQPAAEESTTSSDETQQSTSESQESEAANHSEDNTGNEQAAEENTSEDENKSSKKKGEADALNSKSAVLYCDNTGEIILSKNANDKIIPIDMAKMVTVLLAVQKLPLDKEIAVSEKATEEKGNNLGLASGEVVSAETLIYGVLYYGAPDCIYSIAESVSGTPEKFVKLMNETVKNLGCRETVIKSLYGDSFDKDKSYTTVKDMLTIGKVIMSDKTLGQMMQSKIYSVKKTDKFAERKMERKETLFVTQDSPVKGGISSRVSDDEGVAMVYFEDNGMKLLGILNGKSEESIVDDAKALLDIAKKKVKGIKVVSKGEEVGKARVKHGSKTRIKGYTEEEGMAYLPKEGSKSLINTKVVMKSDLDAPIKKGQLIGTYQIYVADEMVNEINIVSKENVDVGWFPSYIGISNRMTVIIVAVLALLVLLLIVRAVNKAKARKRREILRKRKIQNEALARYIAEQQRLAKSSSRGTRPNKRQ